jgi:cytoskeletal protein CcmA (bactofilin family)
MSSILKKLETLNFTDSIEKREEAYPMLAKEKELDSMTTPGLGGDVRKETILSSDVTFKGTISFKSLLRIDGQFEGAIQSKGTLYVGKTGEIKAEIKAGNVIVEGTIHGNLEAEDKIELRSTAKMFGDIKAAKLVIGEGVSFVGNCNVNPNNEKVDHPGFKLEDKKEEKIKI